jgi:hypothetical protein
LNVREVVIFKDPTYTPLDAQKRICKEAAGIVGKNGSAAETIFPDKAGTNWITADSASTENMHPWTALIPYVVGCVDLRKRYFQTSVSDWIHLRHFHGWLSWGNIRNP